MNLGEQILANLLCIVLLTSCYVLLPCVLLVAFVLDGILFMYQHLEALFRSRLCNILSASIHWVIAPAGLIGLRTICEMETCRIGFVEKFSWTGERTKIESWWSEMINGSMPLAKLEDLGTFMKDYYRSFGAYNIDDTVEQINTTEAATKPKTKEEDRLRRYIQSLESLEAGGLSGNVKTEDVILVALTRLSITDRGVPAAYDLYVSHAPNGTNSGPDIEYYRNLRLHKNFWNVFISNSNLFRPDEPDCAVCYYPLVLGEPMSTHGVCRRSFHTSCFSLLLSKERVCPFDRSRLIARDGTIDDMLAIHGINPPQRVRVLNENMDGETLQARNEATVPHPPVDVRPAADTVQSPLRDAGREEPRVLQEVENGLHQEQGGQENDRPAIKRPHQRNASVG